MGCCCGARINRRTTQGCCTNVAIVQGLYFKLARVCCCQPVRFPACPMSQYIALSEAKTCHSKLIIDVSCSLNKLHAPSMQIEGLGCHPTNMPLVGHLLLWKQLLTDSVGSFFLLLPSFFKWWCSYLPQMFNRLIPGSLHFVVYRSLQFHGPVKAVGQLYVNMSQLTTLQTLNLQDNR